MVPKTTRPSHQGFSNSAPSGKSWRINVHAPSKTYIASWPWHHGNVTHYIVSIVETCLMCIPCLTSWSGFPGKKVPDGLVKIQRFTVNDPWCRIWVAVVSNRFWRNRGWYSNRWVSTSKLTPKHTTWFLTDIFCNLPKIFTPWWRWLEQNMEGGWCLVRTGPNQQSLSAMRSPQILH